MFTNKIQETPYLEVLLDYSTLNDRYSVLVRYEEINDYQVTDEEFTKNSSALVRTMTKDNGGPSTSVPHSPPKRPRQVDQDLNFNAFSNDPLSAFLRRKSDQQNFRRQRRNNR